MTPIPDHVLMDLARSSPLRDQGRFSAEEQAMLAAALPELVEELLTYRRAAAPDPSRDAQLFLASCIIFATPQHPPVMIEAAARAILAHSPNTCERAAAREVLASMKVAA